MYRFSDGEDAAEYVFCMPGNRVVPTSCVAPRMQPFTFPSEGKMEFSEMGTTTRYDVEITGDTLRFLPLGGEPRIFIRQSE